MFFNKKKRTAARIFKSARKTSTEILEDIADNGMPLKEELGAQIDTSKWSFYAIIAAVFLGFQANEAGLSEVDSRELARFVKDYLQKWDHNAPESFYDLADFIITSREKGVDSASATGLWVLIKVKDEMPDHKDMAIAHRIGSLLNRTIV